MASSTKLSRFDLPGLSLPLNFEPHPPSSKPVGGKEGTKYIDVPGTGEWKALFPSILNHESQSSQYTNLARDHRIMSDVDRFPLTTVREFTMLRLMNHLTDKPGWENKIFDDALIAKWEAEALASSGQDVSRAMFKWITAELRWKAKIFQETGAVVIYDGDVVKSDSRVPETLKEALKSFVMPLEDIPEAYKDYHPGSDGKVIDLVHPSLFPLIYGRTRVLADKLVGIDDCLEMTGLGNTIPVPSKDETAAGTGNRANSYFWPAPIPYSQYYQWLPCEVEFSGQGESVKITSYINNLHPRKHQELYAIIEQIISHAIPLWNMTLTPFVRPSFRPRRIEYSYPKYDPDPDTMPASQKPQQELGEDDDEYEDRMWEWAENFRLEHVVQPEPGTFEPPDEVLNEGKAESIDLKRDYGHRGLQVIVKLANISLTSEKPSYDGGSWHIEGQLNEHICATALYYYDSENITESCLAFRQQSREEDTIEINYPQNENSWSGPIFGISNGETCVQNAGDVVCKEGRLITFPNILQHRVQPFRLLDPSKPGHRKILALFLVDPNIRIISTANVPPQQREWWSEELKSTGIFDKFAAELQENVFQAVDDFPIGLDEAKEIRVKLMDERKEFVVLQMNAFEAVKLSLCEH